MTNYKHDEHLGWVMESDIIKTKEKIIPYDSPEAAQLATVTGWVSSNWRFYGDNEDAARHDGCTHRKCSDCDNLTPKHRIYCDQCIKKQDMERWLKKDRKEWDGTRPLYSEKRDKYFFNLDELIDYCRDHNATPEALMLVICYPVYLPYVHEDYFFNALPEDEFLPDDISEALNALNEKIRRSKPVSWSPGKFAPTDESIKI